MKIFLFEVYIYATQKHPKGVKKSEAKSEAAIYVCMLFLYMRLKVLISGRGQDLF